MRRGAAALLLIPLVLLAASLRLRLSKSLPSYDPDDDTGYFHAESAFQYRYALMAARGRPIPELDREAQWPEGVRTRRELTLWMEYATGWACRALPEDACASFRDYVLAWVAVVSSLSIPALYASAMALGAGPWEALAAAAAYGLCWAGFSNTVGTYEFESFALPLIHGSLALFLWSLKLPRRRRLLAAGAGLLMVLALGSWHLTRFYLAGFFAACWFAAGRATQEEQSALKVSAGILLLFCAAAGALVPSLRESRFLLSPAMAVGACLWLWHALPSRRGAVLGACAALLGPVLLARHEAGPYGHAWGMVLAKLANGLQKPVDPSLLSQDARLLWMGPFNSPEAGLALFALLPLALVLAPRLLTRGGPASRPGAGARLTDALLALHAAGTLLVARLLPALAFFLCAAAVAFPEQRRRHARLALVLCAVAALEGVKAYAPYSPWNPFMAVSAAFAAPEERPTYPVANAVSLLRWLKENAGPGRPVLANFISASILTYSESPVLLQPKFEAPAIRAKAARFLRALYSSEEDLAAFCQENAAAFVVYETEFLLNDTKDGPRYASGVKALRPDAAAVLMHFFPERLKGLRLVYENPDYRVFAVGGAARPFARRARPSPVYEWERFMPSVQPDGSLLLRPGGVVRSMQAADRNALLARVLASQGRGAEALRAYEESFASWPPDADLRAEASRLRDSLPRGGR